MSSDLSTVEQEMEQTRERLAATIDQLVHRVHPKTIVSRQVEATKAFFVDPSGQPRKDNIAKVVAPLLGMVVLGVVVRSRKK